MHRKMVPGQILANNGGFSHWGIGTSYHRQQVEPRFVYEHQGTLFFYGLFLTWRQPSCFQRWMAALVSLGGPAQRSLWTPATTRSRRLTWDRWYEIPKVCRMTWAIRLQVKMVPLKPKDSAPRSSSGGICANCSGVKRRAAPGALRRLSPSIPPFLAHRSHWLTAPGVTPSASAMCFCLPTPLAQFKGTEPSTFPPVGSLT